MNATNEVTRALCCAGFRRFVALLAVSAALLSAGLVHAQVARVLKAAPDGEVRYVAPALGRPEALAGVNEATPVGIAARAAIRGYASEFGITDSDVELEEVRSFNDGPRGHAVRYRQLRDGIPVIAGDLVVALTSRNQFQSLSGKTSSRSVANKMATFTGPQAQAIAARATAKYFQMPVAGLTVSEPELSIYDPQLLGPKSTSPPTLVWRVEVRSDDLANPINQYVLIDAHSGAMTLNFNQVETARNRLTYTGNGTSVLQATLVCNESNPSCSNGANPDADAAHRFAGEMYDFYFTRFGRDSYNNAGAPLIQTVQSTYTGCPNAAWLGTQMVYCAGAPLADDVVGHELTHGVTQYTSNLMYYYESGAINESLSDLFGELLDLTNTAGTDTPAVRWKMGEDFPTLGAIRDMMNPPLHSDPDRMTSPLYWKTSGDGGGVHTNSGVNNKAAALLVDGGTFNGFTINAIGLEKVARLYYEVQTKHLTSGSGYSDLYVALLQACQNLIGTYDFVAGDCIEVNRAANAVEMNLEPAPDFNPDAPACSAGLVNSDLYNENFETAPDPSRWIAAAIAGVNGWGVRTGYSGSGVRSYAVVSALSTTSDATLTMQNGVLLPANAYLHFRHSNDHEFSGTSYRDGGVVEYTIDNGVTWNDLGSFHDGGKPYGGTLAAGNPLAGRAAFVGSSHGYVSSRYNLSSLAGNTVRFRFRNVTDASISSIPGRAWVIDDVRVYRCVDDSTPNAVPIADAGANRTVSPGAAVTLSSTASYDTDGGIVRVNWTQVSGRAVAIPNPSAWAFGFTAPATPASETLVFQLQVTDNRGGAATDQVTITVVNQQPVVNAGADRIVRPRESVVLPGSASDPDGSISSYAWTQVAGPPVILANSSGAITSFVAPATPGSELLRFRLTVRDNYNALVFDEVEVTARNLAPTVNAGGDMASKPRMSITLPATSIDPDGAVVTYQWTQVGGPPVSLTNASTNAVTFVAPSVVSSSDFTLRVSVTDNDGASVSDDVVVTIVNDIPIAGAGGDAAVAAGVQTTLNGSGLDNDGAIVSYAWVQVAGPVVTLANPFAAVTTFTAPSLPEASTLSFRLTVTDNDNATASDEMTVSVAAVPKKSGGGSIGGGWSVLFAALLLLRRRAPQSHRRT